MHVFLKAFVFKVLDFFVNSEEVIIQGYYKVKSFH